MSVNLWYLPKISFEQLTKPIYKECNYFNFDTYIIYVFSASFITTTENPTLCIEYIYLKRIIPHTINLGKYSTSNLGDGFFDLRIIDKVVLNIKHKLLASRYIYGNLWARIACGNVHLKSH